MHTFVPFAQQKAPMSETQATEGATKESLAFCSKIVRFSPKLSQNWPKMRFVCSNPPEISPNINSHVSIRIFLSSNSCVFFRKLQIRISIREYIPITFYAYFVASSTGLSLCLACIGLEDMLIHQERLTVSIGIISRHAWGSFSIFIRII